MHGLVQGCRERLLELTDYQAGAADDFAAVGFHGSHDEFQRCRLAGTVTADQAYAFARIDCEFGVF